MKLVSSRGDDFRVSRDARRLSITLALVALLGAASCQRTPPEQAPEPATPPPFKIVKISEARTLRLAAKTAFSDSATAPDGQRFVTLELEPQASLDALETSRLFLLASDQKLFPCRGIGNGVGRYCMMFGLSLKREGENFTGVCAMTGGGAVTSSVFKTNRPTAAFAVPDSIPINVLEMSYTMAPPMATVPADPGKLVPLPAGLSAEVRRLAEGALPGGTRKQVIYVLEVKNRSRRTFRVHAGTIQLHVPEENEKGEITWAWRAPNVGAIDVTDVGAREARLAKPLTIVAPGETRTLGFSFDLPKELNARSCQLGFFREQLLRLADVAPAASAKP